MTEPVIVEKKPLVTTLEPGKYFWCACGRSQNSPFCDGAHQGTGIAPVAFEVTEDKPVALCLCKHTANGPFCDGAHSRL